jgi:hypothetical protein
MSPSLPDVLAARSPGWSPTPHRCGWCGYRGPRSERPVNWSQTALAWLCARCFFSRRYDRMLHSRAAGGGRTPSV